MEGLLSQYRIVAGIGEVNYAAFRLVRRMLEGRGIPYLMFMFARLYSRFYLDSTFYAEHPRAVRAYNQFLKEGVPYEQRAAAEAAINRIVAMRKAPNYTEAVLQVPRTRGAARLLKRVFHNPPGATSGAFPFARLPVEVSPVARAIRASRASFRSTMYRRLTDQNSSDSCRRAIYLLHDSPEYTIDTLGWPYRDQVWLIHRIAESLPLGLRLYVKEHVTMVGRRSWKDYWRLAKHPNVTLLSETTNARDLIAQSDIVFTVSGTAALEALAFGKPAISFSPVFYTHFEGINKCDDVLNLPLLIQKALEEESRRWVSQPFRHLQRFTPPPAPAFRFCRPATGASPSIWILKPPVF